MTGLHGHRVYLDWNATAPLRPEARAAMLEAMDAVGNPSSVHAEGRAAKAIVENARGQVATLVGCEPDEVVFTSGATEAAATILRHKDWRTIACSDTEHECVLENIPTESDAHGKFASRRVRIDLNSLGQTTVPSGAFDLVALASANGETGLVNDPEQSGDWIGGDIFSDITQTVGKPVAWPSMNYRCCSSHKIGGPVGVGAAISSMLGANAAFLKGGGQEKGRRSGTENVIGIAGFGAAAEAAQRDLDDGVWDRVKKLRDNLEETLAEAAQETIFFSQESLRLPNTSCFAVPGWMGETQVMQMDLAGFAVSAGSACSSGKVNKASRVLMAMGFDETTASSAIRVSMGPTTTEAEVMAFADAWKDAYRRRRARAA